MSEIQDSVTTTLSTLNGILRAPNVFILSPAKSGLLWNIGTEESVQISVVMFGLKSTQTWNLGQENVALYLVTIEHMTKPYEDHTVTSCWSNSH